MAQPVRKIIRNLHSDLIKKEGYNTLLVDGNSLMFNAFKDDKINCNGVNYGGVFQFLLQLRLQLEKRDFQVKDAVISLLADTNADQIEGDKGKETFKKELKDKINSYLQEGKVEKVYLTSFNLQ